MRARAGGLPWLPSASTVRIITAVPQLTVIVGLVPGPVSLESQGGFSAPELAPENRSGTPAGRLSLYR